MPTIRKTKSKTDAAEQRASLEWPAHIPGEQIEDWQTAWCEPFGKLVDTHDVAVRILEFNKQPPLLRELAARFGECDDLPGVSLELFQGEDRKFHPIHSINNLKHACVVCGMFLNDVGQAQQLLLRPRGLETTTRIFPEGEIDTLREYIFVEMVPPILKAMDELLKRQPKPLRGPKIVPDLKSLAGVEKMFFDIAIWCETVDGFGEEDETEGLSATITDQFVTVKMIAVRVNLERKSMTKYTKYWPEPDIAHSGRRPNQWKMSRLISMLREQFPEKFPP